MSSTVAYDDVHQRIGLSISNMRASAACFRKVEQAAIAWQRQQQAAFDAGQVFFEALEALATRAIDSSPHAQECGHAYLKIIDGYRQVDLERRDLVRGLGETVILPLTTRIDSDARTLQRMEKEYEKYSKEYVDEVKRAEKELDKWAKKARKMSMEGYSTANLTSAQQNVADRVTDLEQMRLHTLAQVLTEERRRFVGVLVGMVDYMKAEIDYYNASIKPLSDTVQLCEPLCTDPNHLPPGNAKHRVSKIKRPSMPAVIGEVDDSRPGSRTPRNLSSPAVLSGAGKERDALVDRDGLAPGQCRARYAFKGKDMAQLTFQAGDVIEVEGEPEDNWQYGTNTRTGSSGWFPANYIQRKKSADSVSQFSGSGFKTPPPVDYTSAPGKR